MIMLYHLPPSHIKGIINASRVMVFRAVFRQDTPEADAIFDL